jgi:hypothetical protein
MVQGITSTGSHSTWLEAVGWDFGRPGNGLYMAVELGDAESSALRELERSMGAVISKCDTVRPRAARGNLFFVVFSTTDIRMTEMHEFSHLKPMIGTALLALGMIYESCDPSQYSGRAVFGCG